MNKTIVADDYPVVLTASGKVRGLEINGVTVFRGIPYARAERFRAPERPESWDGIRDCYVYGNVCPVSDIMRSSIYSVHRQWEQDEDCLNLNIWTTSLGNGEKRPVMVWLHGGGYSAGSSIDEYTMDGDALAATDKVVVVSVNHRLNYLGYLDLSGYGAEFADSGNAGMLDILAALRWIRENIASFGGDPDNVTLFGQSGGGAKIMTLMQMPAADGLYHKAVIQSGIMPVTDHLRNGKVFADEVVNELGLDRDSIGRIRTLPFADISAAGARAAAKLGIFIMDCFGPHPDGVSVLDDYRTAGFRKEVSGIPVMVGSCIGEMSVFSMHGQKKALFGKQELENYGRDERLAVLSEHFGRQAAKVMEAMEKTYPGIDPMYAPLIDTGLRGLCLDYAGARAKAADAPVYNYLLTWMVPFMEGKLSWHGSDIPMVFGTADRSEVLMCGGEEALKLSRVMMEAWVRFACTGDPSSEDFSWPAFDEEHPATMLFETDPHCAAAHDKELLDVLNSSRS